jgi:hypothetical protein
MGAAFDGIERGSTAFRRFLPRLVLRDRDPRCVPSKIALPTLVIAAPKR